MASFYEELRKCSASLEAASVAGDVVKHHLDAAEDGLKFYHEHAKPHEKRGVKALVDHHLRLAESTIGITSHYDDVPGHADRLARLRKASYKAGSSK